MQGACAIWVLLNLTAYGLIFHDKRQARRGGWRVPEGTLLLPVLLGGGLGAWHAMRRHRHKTKKGSFRFAFRLAVFVSLVAWGLLALQAMA